MEYEIILDFILVQFSILFDRKDKWQVYKRLNDNKFS